MPASLTARKRSQERQQAAWKLHLQGITQAEIAERLELSQGRVQKLLKKAASENPIVQMDADQRAALAFGLLMETHRAIVSDGDEAKAEGNAELRARLLATRSLSASRCARILLEQADTQVNLNVGVDPVMAQMFAPMASSSYEQWAGNGGPTELQSADPNRFGQGSGQPEGFAVSDPRPPLKRPTDGGAVTVDAAPVAGDQKQLEAKQKPTPSITQGRLF